MKQVPSHMLNDDVHVRLPLLALLLLTKTNGVNRACSTLTGSLKLSAAF